MPHGKQLSDLERQRYHRLKRKKIVRRLNRSQNVVGAFLRKAVENYMKTTKTRKPIQIPY